jgi:hypothetical protein
LQENGRRLRIFYIGRVERVAAACSGSHAVDRAQTEYRSGQAAEKLRALVQTTATVLRPAPRADVVPGPPETLDAGRRQEEVPIHDLVPGDVVQLSVGNLVPADIRLLSARDRFVSQSALTGESLPVEKTDAPAGEARRLREAHAGPLELPNVCFMGTTVVSGVTAAEAREVITADCRQRRAPLREIGTDFRYTYEPGQAGREADQPLRPPRVRVVTRRRAWPVMELGLLGAHQAANAAVAVACVEVLREQGWHVSDAAVAAGLAGVRWPARMEVVGRRPLVVLDCAHNVASAEAVVQTLNSSFPPGGRRLLVFAGSSDKDLPGIFRVLAPHFAHAYLTRYAHNPRAVPPEQLAALLRQVSDLPFSLHPTAAAAWQAARAAAGADDLVCVTGSVFLAGELRPVLAGTESGDLPPKESPPRR